MQDPLDAELVRRAAQALNPQQVGEFMVADVGCALAAESGQIFTGSCIGGYLGLCAEQSAVSAMVAVEPPRIRKIVAVWRADAGPVHAIPPCGRCREFLRLMAPENLDTEVILGPDLVVRLRDLLPYPGWYSEPVR